MFGFTPERVDLSTFSCNLVHMTATSSLSSQSSTSPAPGTVLHGVPVVAGVAYAPVIRPGRLPEVDVSGLADVAEPTGPAEGERFTAAAATVAGRLRDRAAHATG
ncbi:phosphoenolpyruvate--protein phosphotransferase, partial [Mycobacterium rufum]|nr:phosphoenolpyruvate--protein phosphotransferase [Mycolicibacterium rufum]